MVPSLAVPEEVGDPAVEVAPLDAMAGDVYSPASKKLSLVKPEKEAPAAEMVAAKNVRILFPFELDCTGVSGVRRPEIINVANVFAAMVLELFILNVA